MKPETPIYRIIHIDNLATCLKRRRLYAPNNAPADKLPYTFIHNDDIQQKRKTKLIPTDPNGNIHDYVPFYFGPRSPMLYQLHTGYVENYKGKQDRIIYLVSTVEEIKKNNLPFVFSDGHGIAAFTKWYNDTNELKNIDWDIVYGQQWNDTPETPDRQRKKQAEFLIKGYLDLSLIKQIGVINNKIKSEVENILKPHEDYASIPVVINPEWYY